MFLVRPANLEDAPTLLKLAKMVHFINLPADPEIIRTKIVRSRKSFAGEPDNPHEREFVFVLEETNTGNVIGTSSVIGCMSWPGWPHTYLQVRRREHYSTDLQTGQVHVTLQLCTDESGTAEVGGLVIGPSYRGHEQRLGMLLSLIRFHFIGRHRDWFSDRIVAEMMGPLTPDSRNLFWESVGRRFINLSFAEADLFCQRSKEFITSLFPPGEIYISLLPAVARHLIGKVGAETEPARRMLEKLGFEYKGHVDPFDGGPYLEANVNDIELVRNTRLVKLAEPAGKFPLTGIVSKHRKANFRGMRTEYAESGDEISLPDDVAAALKVKPGDDLAVTPAPGMARSVGATGSRKQRAAAQPPETVP
jgi:arginine N-succinyltransferase